MSLAQANLFDVLSAWSPWGTARLHPGVAREIATRVEPFLDTPEIVALIGRANTIQRLVQVAYAIEDAGVRRRELRSLAEAKTVFPEADATLVVAQTSDALGETEGSGVDVRPLWRFLAEAS